MKKLCFLVLLFSTGFFSITCSTRNTTNTDITNTDSITVSYLADNVSIFPNPERGWRATKDFMPTGGGIPGNNTIPHNPITLATVQDVTSGADAARLVRDCILVGNLTGDIPQSRLDQISADFNTYRQAGVKVIPRILYHWGMVEPAPGPDEPTLMRHLEQLGVIFRANADVIVYVEAGLYGGTGEPVDDQQHNAVFDHDGWQAISEKGVRGYTKWLNELPQDRMICMRYGRFKWDFMGWDTGGVPGAVTGLGTAGTNAVNLTAANAFNGSPQARIGFHSDSFLGDANSWATYTQTNEKTFCANETNYVPQTGEQSLGTTVNLNGANAMAEMALHHFNSFDNDMGDALDVYPAWKATTAYDDMSRKLGYRFRLISSVIPATLTTSTTFAMTMSMANDGWARIMNPRKVEIIFKNKSTGYNYVMDIDGDGRGNRLWLPGPGETKILEISKPLPAGIPAGKYDLFLNLPDPYPSLHGRPEYSIRLANKDIWNAMTGYNNLQSEICVKE